MAEFGEIILTVSPKIAVFYPLFKCFRSQPVVDINVFLIACLTK